MLGAVLFLICPPPPSPILTLLPPVCLTFRCRLLFGHDRILSSRPKSTLASRQSHCPPIGRPFFFFVSPTLLAIENNIQIASSPVPLTLSPPRFRPRFLPVRVPRQQENPRRLSAETPRNSSAEHFFHPFPFPVPSLHETVEYHPRKIRLRPGPLS